MTRKRLVVASAALLLLALAGAWVELHRAARVTVSVSPQQAVYTVGSQDEAAGLRAGVRVTRYGPLFWGLYPGAVAFRTPGEALKYLQRRGLSLTKWQVFQLSGEYDLDVQDASDPNRINKSLAVVEQVRIGTASR